MNKNKNKIDSWSLRLSQICVSVITILVCLWSWRALTHSWHVLAQVLSFVIYGIVVCDAIVKAFKVKDTDKAKVYEEAV